MALTDIKIKTAKPKDKPYKLADGEGMYLALTLQRLLALLKKFNMILPTRD